MPFAREVVRQTGPPCSSRCPQPEEPSPVTDQPSMAWPVALRCAGVPLRATDPANAAGLLVELGLATADRTFGIDVHLCNAYTLALADRDDRYRAMLNTAALNFPDGAPVAWASKVLHRDEAEQLSRVRGPSLFLDVFEQGQAVGLKHYLL